jgi:hypothetical protein
MPEIALLYFVCISPPLKFTFLDGAYFLDSNPDVFSVILDYLRYKTLVVSPGLAIEAVKVNTSEYSSSL